MATDATTAEDTGPETPATPPADAAPATDAAPAADADGNKPAKSIAERIAAVEARLDRIAPERRPAS